jgi:F-type H+-transporting ATPase subunit epsilon
MIHLQLVTLDGKHIDKDVFEVRVPTTGGTIAINGGHAPLLGAIAPGILTVQYERGDRENKWEQVGVYDGTIEVLNNNLSVLVDEVDSPDDLVEAEVQKAFDLAKELEAKGGDAVSIAEAQAVMDRQAVRLQLANLKKRKTKH